MDKKIEDIIRGYITEISHLSLATSVDGIPWISEVHFSYDDELCLYFVSRPSRRHSREIDTSALVAGNIVKQYKVGEKVRGVYFEGSCKVIDFVSDTSTAFLTYKNRFFIDPSFLGEQKEENGHRWYKITVNKFYLFDELELDPAGKYELYWK